MPKAKKTTRTKYKKGDIVKFVGKRWGWRNAVGEIIDVTHVNGRTLYEMRRLDADAYGYRPRGSFFASELRKCQKKKP